MKLYMLVARQPFSFGKRKLYRGARIYCVADSETIYLIEKGKIKSANWVKNNGYAPHYKLEETDKTLKEYLSELSGF